MYGLILSALWLVVKWFARSIVFKGVMYIALYLFVTEAVNYLLNWMAVDFEGVKSGFATVASGLAYFLKLFRVDVGLPMVISALVLRFTVRRLPIIG